MTTTWLAHQVSHWSGHRWLRQRIRDWRDRRENRNQRHLY